MKQRTPSRSHSGSEYETLPFFVAAFIIGLQLADFVPASGWWVFLGLALVGTALSFVLPLGGRAAWVPLLGCAIACGTFAGTIRAELPATPAELVPFDGSTGRLTGVCSGDFRPMARGGLSFTMSRPVYETASQEMALSCDIRVETRRTEILPEPGQKYSAAGTLSSGDSRRLARFKAAALGEATGSTTLEPSIHFLQKHTRDAISRLLPERHQGFMQGLLLGDTSRLSREDRRLFRDTGVSHLLAVSGQHLLVLAFVLTAILHWSGIPPISRALFTIAVLVGYALMTSGQPSVWRAVAMYVAVALSSLLEADPGPIRPVAAAALAVLLWNPAWVHHVGFQLSFIAVLGIVLGRPPLESLFLRLRLPRVPARYLAVSTAASLSTIPLVAWHFGIVPLAAFVVNPLVVWSFDFILPIGLFMVIMSVVWFQAGVFLAAGLALALDAFMAAVRAGAALPLALVDVGSIPAGVVAAAYAALLGIAAWHQQLSSAPARAVQPAPQSPAVSKASHSVPRAGRQPEKSAPTQDEVWPEARKDKPAEEPRLNPLTNDSLVEAIDGQLAVFPKRALKQQQGRIETMTFPVQALSPESQNIFHRLDDLTLETLRGQPDRLLEAHVYCMAMLGNELLSRVAVKLEPPPTPADIQVRRKAHNRFLALVLTSEAFFNSPLPGRATRAGIAMLIPQAYELHKIGCEMLYAFTKLRDEGKRLEHFEYRKAVLAWCRSLIDALATDEKRRRPVTKQEDPHES
ncbi:MAG: ComEC family competence protein [bacterium ADurb.Bin374]|nr:MAG: ComEC family competence protein [bacterium ADurb.Bin374]